MKSKSQFGSASVDLIGNKKVIRKLPIHNPDGIDLKKIEKLHEKNFLEIIDQLDKVKVGFCDVGVFYGIKRPIVSNKNIRTTLGLTNWSRDVIERFHGYCCICYSKKKPHAHHLFSYKHYPELRTDINNGVCICNECHVLFHEMYLTVTIAGQFIDFMRIMKSEKLRKYLEIGFKVLNICDFTNQRKRHYDEFEVVQTHYYKFLRYRSLIVQDNTNKILQEVYYGPTLPLPDKHLKLSDIYIRTLA